MGRWMLRLGGIIISIASLEIQWLLPRWRHSQGKCQVGRRCLFTTACLWVLNFSTCLDFVGANQPFGSASHRDDASSGRPHGSYSLCFFNRDQNLLEDGKLLHVAVSAFPLFLPPDEPSFLPFCIVLTRKVAQTHSAAWNCVSLQTILCKRSSSSF